MTEKLLTRIANLNVRGADVPELLLPPGTSNAWLDGFEAALNLFASWREGDYATFRRLRRIEKFALTEEGGR